MASSQPQTCQNCIQQTATQICSKCVNYRLQCAACSAQIHAKHNASHHKPRSVCEHCFNGAASISCHDCNTSVCRACVVEHSQHCQPSDSEEELIEVEDDGSSEDDFAMPPPTQHHAHLHKQEPAVKTEPAVGNKPPCSPEESTGTTQPNRESKPPKPKPAKPKKPTVKQVAELLGEHNVFESHSATASSSQKVSKEVLVKIQKALALGLHAGGHEAEKTHAMKRATRLMQRYGLSQAEVSKVGKGDVKAVAGVVTVRLNGLFQRWPLWGKTLMGVANVMANTKAYFNRARKGSTELEHSMTVSFYGLKADAAMAGSVFEVAYNLVLEKGTKEYGNRGKSRSIMDYRQGLCNGLYAIAQSDKQLRDASLNAARARSTTAAKAAESAAARKRPETGTHSDSDVHDEHECGDDDDGWSGGWDGGSSSDEDDEYGGDGEEEPRASEHELQQLVLYDDKAKLAREAVEDQVKIKKAKKLKQRAVTDWAAYSKGQEDARTVKLGSKTLPASSAHAAKQQQQQHSKSAGAGEGAKSSGASKRRRLGKEHKTPPRHNLSRTKRLEGWQQLKRSARVLGAKGVLS